MHSQDARQRWVAPSHYRAAVTSEPRHTQRPGEEKLSLPFPPPKYWWTCYSSPSMTHLYTTTTIIMMRATHFTHVICVILSRHTLLSPAAPRPSVSQAEIEMHLIYWSEYMAAGWATLIQWKQSVRLTLMDWSVGAGRANDFFLQKIFRPLKPANSFSGRQLEDRLSLPHRMELNSLTNVWKGRRPNLYES